MYDITDKNDFDSKIGTEATVIALFSADWCPDCRIIEPFLPELEQNYKSLTFVEVDRDKLADVCEEYDILGIPSFIAFKNSKVIDSFVSTKRKTRVEIETFLDKIN